MHACKLKSAFMRPIWYSMRKKQVYHTKIIISSVSVTVWALFQPSPALPSPPQLGTVQKANPEPMMRRLEQRDQSREFIDPHPGH